MTPLLAFGDRVRIVSTGQVGRVVLVEFDEVTVSTGPATVRILTSVDDVALLTESELTQ